MMPTKEQSEPRFAIGIDLGTTNCALAFVDRLGSHPARSQVFQIQQYEGPGVARSFSTLPSFLYFPAPGEERLFESQRARPWADQRENGTVVLPGVHARTRAREVPGRVAVSAKSWLASAGLAYGGAEIPSIDADQAILPWGSTDISGAEKLSPLDVSAHYLLHLKMCWDAEKASHESSYQLENQDVVITVPASFDEVAQRLTLEAARRAGFGPRVRLLEEPQAAFYRFLESEEEQSSDTTPKSSSLKALLQTKPSIRLLVCDMGGGTTDFSVFAVSEHSGVERIAVSDHLLLGGDNIDLTIARALEVKMLGQSERLSAGQWGYLIQASRSLKEQILTEGQAVSEGSMSEKRYRVAVPPEGGNLFAASLSAELTLAELSTLVLQGFFPDCALDEKPLLRKQGLRELGLPYAADTAVTRHLASFLNRILATTEFPVGDSRIIDAVLFVGGSFTPTIFRAAILRNIEKWQGAAVRECEQQEFDLGVARGAAVFASLNGGERRKIRAGYSHSVYLEVRETKSQEREGARTLLCVLPQGAEPGSRYRVVLPHLKVVLERAVQFQAFTSMLHPGDQAGDTRTWAEEDFHQLAPLQTTVTLPASADRPAERGQKIPVALEVEINDLGMLQVFLSPAMSDHSDQRFELQFNLRSGSSSVAASIETQSPEVLSDSAIDQSAINTVVNRYFGKKIPEGAAGEKLNPGNLVRELEQLLGAPRAEWTLPQLRAMWAPLAAGMSRRSRSLTHEVVWLSLAGFVLRPGYGAPLDAVRVNEAWKLFDQGLFFPKEARARVQWWIFWRRLSGGLSSERQEKIFLKLQATLQARSFEDSENLLLAGSLERLSSERKTELGNLLLKRLQEGKGRLENCLWALSRVGARSLLSAGPEFVVGPRQAEGWLEGILSINWKPQLLDRVASCIVQLGRLTGERALDISPELVLTAIDWLHKKRISSNIAAPLRELMPINADERKIRFGEELPAGLELG